MIRRSLPILLLLAFFGLAMSSLTGDSPTMDEQNHIARGLAFLRTGDPRLSVEHPPLINVLAALPLLTESVTLPVDDWSWEAAEWYRFADLLLWHSQNDADRMVFLARLPILWLSLLLGASLFRLTRAWFPAAVDRRWVDPALVALMLFVFDPNLMAHSRYVTTDLGAAALVFWSSAALWWAVGRRFSLPAVVGAGAVYGLALSAKLSTLVFGPMLALLGLVALLSRWRAEPLYVRRVLLRFCVAYPVAALLVVWAVFAFDWGPVSAGGLAVPMPVFWRGVQAILDQSGGGRPGFLLGRFSTEGFAAYFIIALGVKTPLATLGLLGWAAARLGRRMVRGDGPGARSHVGVSLWLVLPALGYLAVSSQSAVNLGYRHLLPMLPLLFAFGAGQFADLDLAGTVGWAGRLALGGLLVWVVGANLSIFPHYLSYFNEVVGPGNGYRVLVDSNIDWGQDLKRLRHWMQSEGQSRVKLAWFGSAPPQYYGVDYDPLPGLPHHFDLWENPPFNPAEPGPGTYAISVSMLQELHRRDEDKTVFAWFRARKPDDRVGYSVLIYEVP